MKCLIVGTHDQKAKTFPQFKSACEAIGKLLAEKGHVIVIGGTDSWTADFNAVIGANLAKGKKHSHKVILCAEEPDKLEKQLYDAVKGSPDSGATDMDKVLPYIAVAKIRLVGIWPRMHIDAFASADVAIVIGGDSGVIAIGVAGAYLTKYVVAVGSFGGMAAEVYKEASLGYGRAGIEEADILTLNKEWKEGSAETVVAVAEKLADFKPARQDVLARLLLLFVILGLISGWVSLFTAAKINPHPWYVFVMVGLAAFVGIISRAALGIKKGQTLLFCARDMIVELILGATVAIAYCLMYLCATYVFTGKFLLVEGKDQQSDDFVRLSIFVSLLGLAAGIRLENAIAIMQGRLDKMLRNSNMAGSSHR